MYKIIAGSDGQLTLDLKDQATIGCACPSPANLTDVDAVSGFFPSVSGIAVVLVASVVDPLGGRIRVPYTAVESLQMNLGEDQDFEIRADASGQTFVWQYPARLTVNPLLFDE